LPKNYLYGGSRNYSRYHVGQLPVPRPIPSPAAVFDVNLDRVRHVVVVVVVVDDSKHKTTIRGKKLKN
jgi:hypothetical protein